MDDAAGKIVRPALFERRELGRNQRRHARLDTIGFVLMRREKRAPAVKRERIGAAHAEVRPGEMKLAHGFAQRRAMRRVRMVHRIAFEKGDDRSRPSDELPERFALPILDRQRTGDALRRQMLHQGEEEGQIAFRNALFIKREDEISRFQMQKVIRVLDALGDALA